MYSQLSRIRRKRLSIVEIPQIEFRASGEEVLPGNGGFDTEIIHGFRRGRALFRAVIPAGRYLPHGGENVEDGKGLRLHVIRHWARKKRPLGENKVGFIILHSGLQCLQFDG